ncbi:MAG: TonB-dependent receptor plug domain-containing protein, partial [Gammaproteobacteria bacterium]
MPIAVSAITRADIAETHVTSLSDIASRLSGFHFGEVAGAGQASIRGVGFSLVTGAGEGSVAIHTDGLFLSRPGSITMLQEGLERIEVLRGPQGTLYGRNATAGVVNLSTPDPPEQLDAGIGVLGGDIGRRKYSFHLGRGFLDGMLKLRLGGVTDENTDFFINEQFPGLDMGASDQSTFRLAGDLLATDTLHFQLRAFTADQTFNGPLYAAYKPPPDSALAPPGTYSDDPYKTRTNEAGASEKTLRGGSLKAVWDILDGLVLSSQTGYVKFQFDTPAGHGYDGDGTSNDTFTVYRFNPSDTISEELNLNWESSGWQWIAGAFYLTEEITLNFDVDASLSGLSNTAAANLFPGVDPNVIDQALDPAGQSQNIDIQNYSFEKTTSWAVFGDTTYA